MKQLRIVIADDSELIRDLLCNTFLTEAGFAIVGAAADGIEALQLVNELRPDVVVLDISMPLMGGIEVLKEIRKYDQSTVIIMFSADDSPFIGEFCRQVGANFFLSKCELKKLIKICKRQLLAGPVGVPAGTYGDVAKSDVPALCQM
jgi:DNA-binding NarL/FixJ family response regulator